MPKQTTTRRYYTVTASLPNGKRKYYRGKTKEEAEEKRDKDLKGPRLSDRVNSTITVSELSSVWINIRSQQDLHERSLETVQGILNRYIVPSIGHLPVWDVQPYHIRVMMAEMSGYSSSTQRKILQYTRSIFELAVENNIISRNPCVNTIKSSGKKPQEVEPLTDEQCKVLLSATEGTRVWLFIMLLLYAGLRKGEALGLMWKDIDFSNETIQINRTIVYLDNNKHGIINKNCKSEAAHRTIPMIKKLSAALLAAKNESKSQYVFSMRNNDYLSDNSYRSMWRLVEDRSVKTLTKQSINDRPIDFKVHPHMLRHTFATRLIRGGMEPKQVMYLLGHSSLKVTMEIYVHYQEELRRAEAHSKMEETWNYQ